MIPFRSAAIAGLGLIGGSLARDLSAAGIEVTGADSDPGALEAAMREGVLARGSGADLSEFGDVEVIVLALPADAAGRALNLLTTRPLRARLITDTGGTKRAILAAAEAGPLGERFVGSHPFAGDHRSGWGSSRPGLFRDAKVYLSPSSRATADAVSLAHELWRLSGGAPEIIDPASHDRKMAFASHLPQIVSSAVGAVLAEAGFARSELGSGGRDVARLAGSSPDLWTPLCLENAEMLRAPLSALRSEIELLDTALAAGDEERVRSFFVRARDWSDFTAR